MRPGSLRARLLACGVVAAVASIPASASADDDEPATIKAPAKVAAPADLHLIELPYPEPLPPGPDLPPRSGASFYTGRKPYKRPSLRVATGVSVRVSGAGVPAAYTMDLLLGGHFGLHPGDEQLGLIPEIGYSWRTPGREHQLTAGVGLAWGMGMAYHTIAIIPRLVIDPSQGPLGVGLRTSLLWCFRENGFAAELAHQYVQRGALAVQDVRATLSLDVMLLALVVSGVRKL